MVEQACDAAERVLKGVLGVVGPEDGGGEPGVRYRLDVVAADVADVVRFAGGWLFDRAMAGWDVTVIVADHSHERPLQILGAQIVDLEHALASAGDPPPPHTLAPPPPPFASPAPVPPGVVP